MKILRKYYTKKFIKTIDKNIKVKFGKRLECEPRKNKVFVAFHTSKVDSITFMEYVKELNSKCNFNDLILGILHEIGHIYTHSEDDEEEYQRDTELLSLLYKQNKLSDMQVNYFYLRQPMESKATEWAINFAMLNPEFVSYYQKKIGNGKII